MMGVPITGRPIIYLNAYHKNNEGFNLHISFLGQYSGSVLAVQKTPISCPSLMNMSIKTTEYSWFELIYSGEYMGSLQIFIYISSSSGT